MSRTIQFEGRTIQVPDDATDADVAGILSAKPAPDLASVGADANRELVQQPGALDAQNAAGLASLAGPSEPSLVDRLKSSIFGDKRATGGLSELITGQPAAPADPNARGVMDQAAYVPAGVRRGVSKIAGFLPDLISHGLTMAGAPRPTSMPSETIDTLLRAGGLIPDVRPPSTPTERALTRVSEEVGAAAVPIGAALNASKMGVQAARELPTLARMFVEPAAISPGAFTAKEMATAAAAGTGAAATGELSHAVGLKEGGAAHNTLDILGALAGAGMLGAGRIVGKPLNDVRQAIFSRDKFSNDTVKNNVVDRLINNADTLPKTEGQAVDTAPLVDAINRGARVDATIPGFKDSVADRTGDSGLAALEYGRQSGQGAGQFTARRADNTAAVDEAMNRNAPDGNPAALRSELELERNRRLTDAGVQTQNANDAFERATQALQPAMTGEGRGANIRSALEGASGEARAILQQAWAPINRSGVHVDMAPLAEDFAGVREGLSTAESRRFQPPEAGIPRELSGEREVVKTAAVKIGDQVFEAPNHFEALKRAARETGQTLDDVLQGSNEGRVLDGFTTSNGRFVDRAEADTIASSAGQKQALRPGQRKAEEGLGANELKAGETDRKITQPINEVTGLRSALTDASREAMTAGRTNEARIIDQHVTALDHYLDHAVPPELRAEYDAARAATVDFHDRFTRPQTAIAQTLDRQEGLYRQPDSAVAGKFVQADEGKINDFQALMRETGHDERTVSAVRDQILADVRDRGLLAKPEQLQEYLGRYNTVLSDPRFAGVRGQLDNAAGLRRSLDTATAAETDLTRSLGTTEKPGTSTVGKYLQYGDERSQDALKGVIASKNPGAAMDEMLGFVNNAPEAVAGARKSFWDLMQSKARSNGETTKTMDGAQPWMPNRLKNFLDDPAHQAVAERLYRDEPEQLANIRKISDELQGVDLRARGKAPNTSGTAQGISNVLTPETLQSRFYAYKRGQTSLGFMLTALGSVAARRLVRGAQGEAMEKLLDKALLEPDLAAQLLKDHNPANRAALARTAKAYLPNEASTLMNLLDEPTRPFKDDPIKSAIMKKDEGDGR